MREFPAFSKVTLCRRTAQVLWLLFTSMGRLHTASGCHYREVCYDCCHKPPAVSLAALSLHSGRLFSPNKRRQVFPHP